MKFIERVGRDRLIRCALVGSVATAFVLPFSTALTNILFIATAVFWLLGSDLKRDWKQLIQKPFACVLLLFLLFVCLSGFWKEGSWSSYWSELRNYRRFLFFLIIFLLLQNRDVWRERILFSFFASTALLALICIGIYFEVPFLPPMREGQGAILLKNHITQGLLLGCHMVIAIRYIAFSEHVWLRIVSAVTATLAFVVTVFMTYGRTGYLCGVVCICFSVFFFWTQGKKRLAFSFFAVFVVSLAMISVSDHVQSRWENAQTDIAEFSAGNIETSMGLRFYFWRTSLSMIKDHPILGIGCGSVEEVSCRYAEKTPDEDEPCFSFSNPHQDYLFVLVQYGIGGFLLWMAFFCLIFKESLRCSLKEKWGLWGMLALYLSGGLFNTFSRDITESSVFALLVAVLLTGTNVIRDGQCEQTRRDVSS